MSQQVPEGLEATLTRSAHPYFYWESLVSTPEGLELVLSESSQEQIRAAAVAIAAREFVHCIGCGTSYYNAMATAYALEMMAGVPASAHDAYEFVSYPPANLDQSALVATSHSGKTAAAVEGVQIARPRGVPTVGFSDYEGSPLYTSVEFPVVSPNPEKQGPKNRSFVASLLRSFLLAIEVAQLRGREVPQANILQHTPQIVSQILQDLQAEMKSLAQTYAGNPRIVVIGGGPQWVAANEANLKFIETALINTDAWELEEAVHGTWMCLKDNDLVVILGVRGPGLEKCKLLTRGFKVLGTKLWVITDAPEDFPDAHHHTVIPAGHPEWVTPMFTILPLYQFIYEYTLLQGLHPDRAPYGDPRYAAARKIIRESTKTSA